MSKHFSVYISCSALVVSTHFVSGDVINVNIILYACVAQKKNNCHRNVYILCDNSQILIMHNPPFQGPAQVSCETIKLWYIHLVDYIFLYNINEVDIVVMSSNCLTGISGIHNCLHYYLCSGTALPVRLVRF